jgi:hypothetical protein
MKTVRGFIVGLIVAGALGGAAGATPTVAHLVSKPSSSGVLPAPVPALRPPAAKGSETPGTDEGKDSSTGLTGLDNAIAHVSQNLADHPNKGLANALAHLQGNKAKHEAKRAGKDHAKQQDEPDEVSGS